MKRLKYLASVVPGQSPDSKDVRELAGGLPFIQGNAEFGTRHPSPRYECSLPPKTASSGDILISVRAPVGALNVADQSYGIGRGLAAVHPVHIDGSYAWWWLHAQKQQLEAEGTGSTFSAVAASDISNLVVPIEDPTWQSRISKFLDRETAQIDVLIAKQERLIQLLSEKRRAVIAQAVTKGLDSSAPTKPSGVSWLGDIPAHWRAVPLKWLSKLTTGITPATANEDNFPTGVTPYPWVRPEDLDESGRPTVASKFLSKEAWGGCRPVRPDTVLICCIGATLGKVGLVEQPVVTNQQITSVETDMVGFYLFAAISSARQHIEAMSVGNTLPILNSSRLGTLTIPVPPKEEQLEIAECLKADCNAIDGLRSKAQQVIRLLQERRSALISAAVTGKIDVFEGAA